MNSEETPLTPGGPKSPYDGTRGGSITRRSSVTNLTSYIPANIAANVPFLPNSARSQSNVLQETYFCHICFMNNPKKDGFTLRNCHHTFCRECIKGYMTSRINDGQVFLKCFHPPTKKPGQYDTIDMPNTDAATNNNMGDNEDEDDENGISGVVGGAGGTRFATCHTAIAELDIKACVEASIWEKFARFKTNIENPNARQCPFCQHTQFGSKDNPIMTCENEICLKQYCFFHSNAHDPSEPCESYDARMLKQNKLNEARINERAKRCPGCNFPIEKISGCNHMRCIKCQTSFCWICEQIIDDAPVPSHYKDPDSPCHGKQFEGADMGQTPPMWAIVVLAIFTLIFGFPTLIIAVVLGCVFWPIAACFRCCVPEERKLLDPKARPKLKDVISGCWFSWMIFFLTIVVFIPLCLFACIYRILLYIPPFSWCLPDIFDADETTTQNEPETAEPDDTV